MPIPIVSSRGNLANLPGTDMPSAQPIAQAGADIARGAQAIGAGLQNLGAGIEVWQARKDDAAATDAFNTLRARSGEAVLGRTDPDGTFRPGLLSRRGADAAGVSADYGRQAREMMDDVSRGLDGQALRLFKERAEPLVNGYMEHLASHEATEGQRARAETYVSGAAGAADDAVRGWQSDDVYALNVSTGAAQLAAGLRLQGHPEAFVAGKVAEYRGDADARRANAMVAAGAFDRADAFAKASTAIQQEKRDDVLVSSAKGRQAQFEMMRKMQSDAVKQLEDEASGVKYRLFKGEIDAKTALAQTDQLFAKGLPGEKATDIRDFVVKQAAASADAATLLAGGRFAKPEEEDASVYIDLLKRTTNEHNRFDTETKILAAAKAGLLTEAHFTNLYETNRKGINSQVKAARDAVFSVMSGMDVELVKVALSNSTTEAAQKNRTRLMKSLSYDYDRPYRIDIGRQSITPEELDKLTETTQRFMETNPGKDPVRDYLNPLFAPKTDAERALKMKERMALRVGPLNAAAEASADAADRRAAMEAARMRAAKGGR